MNPLRPIRKPVPKLRVPLCRVAFAWNHIPDAIRLFFPRTYCYIVSEGQTVVLFSKDPPSPRKLVKAAPNAETHIYSEYVEDEPKEQYVPTDEEQKLLWFISDDLGELLLSDDEDLPRNTRHVLLPDIR